MSNTTAQRNARNGAELGDLRRRLNDAALSTYIRTPAEQAQALIDTMDAAKLTGDRGRFYAAQQALRALVDTL